MEERERERGGANERKGEKNRRRYKQICKDGVPRTDRGETIATSSATRTLRAQTALQIALIFHVSSAAAAVAVVVAKL